jgi:hypothetical protein
VNREHVTPRASLIIRSLLHQNFASIGFVLIDYAVPLKPGNRSPASLVLEALIARSTWRALTFVTTRGEG